MFVYRDKLQRDKQKDTLERRGNYTVELVGYNHLFHVSGFNLEN